MSVTLRLFPEMTGVEVESDIEGTLETQDAASESLWL